MKCFNNGSKFFVSHVGLQHTAAYMCFTALGKDKLLVRILLWFIAIRLVDEMCVYRQAIYNPCVKHCPSFWGTTDNENDKETLLSRIRVEVRGKWTQLDSEQT
jgi:hypothetical protein